MLLYDNNTFDDITKDEWDARNVEIPELFDKWLDSSRKDAFEIDPYNIFEKLPLREVRLWLKPDSEGGFSYNSYDEVEEDFWWDIGYTDGSVLHLGPGDSLVGVRRSGILYAINTNANTTMIYGKSNYISIYNDSDYDEFNDIWRVETTF